MARLQYTNKTFIVNFKKDTKRKILPTEETTISVIAFKLPQWVLSGQVTQSNFHSFKNPSGYYIRKSP